MPNGEGRVNKSCHFGWFPLYNWDDKKKGGGQKLKLSGIIYGWPCMKNSKACTSAQSAKNKAKDSY